MCERVTGVLSRTMEEAHAVRDLGTHFQIRGDPALPSTAHTADVVVCTR